MLAEELFSGDQEVPTSLMPKGVEHRFDPKYLLEPLKVPTSLMPKGVEHITSANSLATPSGCPPL